MNILKLGDQGPQVLVLQKLLRVRNLLPLFMMGMFDIQTEAAVKTFQSQSKLTPDGAVGPKTWEALNLINLQQAPTSNVRSFPARDKTSIHQKISEILSSYADQIDYFGRYLAIDTSLLASILAVESSGRPLSAKGEPIIRFEVHWFYKTWGLNNYKIFTSHFRFDAKEPWKGHQYQVGGVWKDVHTSQDTEQEAYALAMGLSTPPIASECMSIGLAQIMGFHYKRLGYSSARDFYLASYNPKTQVLNFLQFIASEPKLLESLQLQDLKAFTRAYNGSGQVDKYSTWIYDHWQVAKTYI